mgnify:CR=1 FL=1
MHDALVGATGFVGGNLLRQREFGATYRSSTIDLARGSRFGTLVIAGAPGSMFAANRDPDADAQAIRTMTDVLRTTKAVQAVLISTIAVLADPASGADEAASEFEATLAYGRHRRQLERWCHDHFPRCLVVRLPALFGTGLRKNFLFDLHNPMPSMLTDARYASLLLTLDPRTAKIVRNHYHWSDAGAMWILDRAEWRTSADRTSTEQLVAAAGFSAVGFTNPESQFQYYPLRRLWRDIKVATDAGLDMLHCATAPVRAGDVFERLAGGEMPTSPARIHRERMTTRHGHLWGRDSEFLMSRDEVLDEIVTWARDPEREA